MDTPLPPAFGPAESISLPLRLKQATQDLHAQAERSGVMGRLLSGRADRAAYARLLRSLHPIYASLEAALDRLTEWPALQRLNLRELHRREAIEADLSVLHGARWHDEVEPGDAARRYAERLEDAARQQPLMLAAHAYVRWLGDLHGGQILQRVVRRSLVPQSDAEDHPEMVGTAFYQFGPPQRVLELRQALRDALARLNADEAAVDQLVDEARWAFEQHRRLFEELDTA